MLTTEKNIAARADVGYCAKNKECMGVHDNKF